MVCSSRLSKLSSSDTDTTMSMITHAVDHKREAATIGHQQHQHLVLRMLASNKDDQEHSHAMYTVQGTASQ